MIIQQRIHELQEYIQLGISEDGYEDPSSLWFAIDKVGWAKAKKFNMANIYFSNHIEAGFADVSSVNVEVEFDTEFSTGNYVFLLQVYKDETMDLGEGDVTVRTSIPYHSLSQTVSGFTLTLAEYSNVVVQYFAYE